MKNIPVIIGLLVTTLLALFLILNGFGLLSDLSLERAMKEQERYSQNMRVAENSMNRWVDRTSARLENLYPASSNANEQAVSEEAVTALQEIEDPREAVTRSSIIADDIEAEMSELDAIFADIVRLVAELEDHNAGRPETLSVNSLGQDLRRTKSILNAKKTDLRSVYYTYMSEIDAEIAGAMSAFYDAEFHQSQDRMDEASIMTVDLCEHAQKGQETVSQSSSRLKAEREKALSMLQKAGNSNTTAIRRKIAQLPSAKELVATQEVVLTELSGLCADTSLSTTKDEWPALQERFKAIAEMDKTLSANILMLRAS